MPWPAYGQGMLSTSAGRRQHQLHHLLASPKVLGGERDLAASHLPVITDQPEDAVPTRSVFDSLAPTLREQRVERQFIVLGANQNNSAHVGRLFDGRIRDAALEHLEGGRSAFALRAARYAEFGNL